LIKQDKEKCD